MKRSVVAIFILFLLLLALSGCSTKDNFLTDIADEVGSVVGKDKTPQAPTVPDEQDPDQEQQEQELDEPPVQEELQREYVQNESCVDSAKGDTTKRSVIDYKATEFVDYCCGDLFKMDYYCKDGKAQSEANVLCPLGCTAGECELNICGDAKCIGDEFVSCERDCGEQASTLDIVGIEISDLNGELDGDYFSLKVKNTGSSAVNLRNYFVTFYDYAYPQRTSSSLYNFSYGSIPYQTLAPGDTAVVSYLGALGGPLDVVHCNKLIKVGLANKKWSKQCIAGSVTLVEEFITVKDVVLKC